MTGDHEPLGRLEPADGRSRLVFRRTVDCLPADVFAAVTQPDGLASWFPTTIEGVLDPGAPLRFSFRNAEGEPFSGDVVAFEPSRRWSIHWGDDLLDLAASPQGTATVLDFRIEFSPVGRAARDAAGWHVCLDLLAAHCAHSPVSWTVPQRWREVHPQYVARFGPQAATIGVPEHRADRDAFEDPR